MQWSDSELEPTRTSSSRDPIQMRQLVTKQKERCADFEIELGQIDSSECSQAHPSSFVNETIERIFHENEAMYGIDLPLFKTIHDPSLLPR